MCETVTASVTEAVCVHENASSGTEKEECFLLICRSWWLDEWWNIHSLQHPTSSSTAAHQLLVEAKLRNLWYSDVFDSCCSNSWMPDDLPLPSCWYWMIIHLPAPLLNRSLVIWLFDMTPTRLLPRRIIHRFMNMNKRLHQINRAVDFSYPRSTIHPGFCQRSVNDSMNERWIVRIYVEINE